MKTKLLRIAVLICSAIFAQAANCQTAVRLLCQGYLETSKDGGTNERKATSVDVVLDLTKKTIELDGYWGCMADINSEAIKPEEYKCHGKQFVQINDGEIVYFAKSEGEKYYGQTNLSINRYSATLTVNTYALANPPAQANWALMLISGKLQCVSQDKKF